MLKQPLLVLFALFLSLTSASGETVHTVLPGETLSSIARSAFGDSAVYHNIARLNGISPPYRIRAGQRIRIPDSSRPDTPVAIAANTPAPSPDTATMNPDRLPVPTPPEDPIGSQELNLIDVSGTVEVIRGGNAIVLEPGARVRAGDTIRAGAFARALLSGMGGERYIVGANTSILLKELSATYADRRVVIRVDHGGFEIEAPETPFLTRYLIETPSGSASLRFGRIRFEVAPPSLTSLSVLSGECLATVPRGSITVPREYGAILNTTEPPPPPVPLPSRPGFSAESTAASAILAAALQPGHRLEFEIFRDPDLQRFVAARPATPNAYGVALARVELPLGRYWVLARSTTRSGLSGPVSTAGPITITGAR